MFNGKFTSPNDPGWDLEKFCKQVGLKFRMDVEAIQLWVDVETTGLNLGKVRRDHIIEVSCIATSRDLVVVDVFHSYVWKGVEWSKSFATMGSPVLNMHKHSGLYGEIEDLDKGAGIWPDSVTDRFRHWIAELGFEMQSTPMYGSTVSFDRGMLQQDMPDFLEPFSYRNVDVSSLKELCKIYNTSVYEAWKAETDGIEKSHRSLLDICSSIKEMQFYVDNFLWVE